jgi:hypothetical protein
LPLSNHCNNFGNEGSGGNEMGAQENLQVKDIVALVSFLTCYKSMASKICGSGHLYSKQHFVRAFVDGTKCFIEEMF